jgi:hypothetical protein
MSRTTQPRIARGGRLSIGKSAARRTGLGVLFVSAMAFLALASSAGAATTVTATVNGAQTGTPTASQPVIATLNTTIDNNGANPPVPIGASGSLTQTFPSEFASNLASFGSCPESKFNDAATPPGGPADPSVSCPANSLVGTGSFKSYVPPFAPGPPGSLVASEKVVIVKDADTGGLAFWTTFQAGGTTSGFAKGTIGTNAAGQTTITWDPSIFQPDYGSQVDLLEFNTTYNDNQSALQTPEPFSNTGCASGSWTFSVTNPFIDGPATQTINASAPCTTLTAPSTAPVAAVVPGTATLKSSKVNVSSLGLGQFKLNCSTAGACVGSFEIRPAGKKSSAKKGPKKPPLAKGSYSIPAGKSGLVPFKLTGKGRSLLAKHDGKLSVHLRLTPTSGKSSVGSLTLQG